MRVTLSRRADVSGVCHARRRTAVQAVVRAIFGDLTSCQRMTTGFIRHVWPSLHRAAVADDEAEKRRVSHNLHKMHSRFGLISLRASCGTKRRYLRMMRDLTIIFVLTCERFDDKFKMIFHQCR